MPKKMCFSVLSPVVIFALNGCATAPSTPKNFVALVEECIGPNWAGAAGQVVFLGPNDYRPGDMWTRAQAANGVWTYDPRATYADTVGADVAKSVISQGNTPITCNLDTNNQFKVNGTGEFSFLSAALPATATANFDYSNGSVTALKLGKVTIDSLHTFDPYTNSLRALSPLNTVSQAVKEGGYYVSSAIVFVEGYSVEVKYGSDVSAGLKGDAHLGADATKGLKAGVEVSKVDANTLQFSVPGKVALAAVFRPLSKTFEVQSATQPGEAPQPAIVAQLTRRGQP